MSRSLWKPVVQEAKLNHTFKSVAESGSHSAARGQMDESFSGYHDKDGHFLEQFQTTGFDTRTFEPYLHTVFVDIGTAIDAAHARPDLVGRIGKTALCIEAVTANHTGGNPSGYSALEHMETIQPPPSERRASATIRLAGALYSKLQMKYWQLPWAVGKPLIFAIQNFSGAGVLKFSSSSLTRYLYGLDHRTSLDARGELVITPRRIGQHQFVSKVIPSGFFDLPDAEYISGVLFSNSGRIPKFNRMGRQGAYRSPNVRMIGEGYCQDHDPD